jgi:membrane protein
MNRLKPAISFVKEISNIWARERPVQLAAALAYFGMFSFAPIVYIAFFVAGIFLNEAYLSERLTHAITEWIGPEAVQIFQSMLMQVEKPGDGQRLIASLISIGALIYAATGVFFQLKFSLNSIWGIPPPVKGGIVWMIRERLVSFLLTIGVGLVLLVAGVLSAFANWLDTILPFSWFNPLYSILVFIGLTTVSFAIMYKILPDTRLRWRDVWGGALTSALLITLAIRIVSFLIGISTFKSALEAAGSIVIVLIGINYLAQIFLLGAIITRVYAHRYGSLSSFEK